ncbi:hypothetical protein D5086_023575 [Populus alba]|uniref:Uncharacterized protein n=1 Tax=Populus alba TaxID=43335 RepID=A0ACC4BA68_POPAL
MSKAFRLQHCIDISYLDVPIQIDGRIAEASNPSSSTVHDVRFVLPNQSSISVASVSRYSDAQSIDAKAESYISTVRQRFTLG